MDRMCEGRVAVITGAGRGIGREYALNDELADQRPQNEGFDVIPIGSTVHLFLVTLDDADSATDASLVNTRNVKVSCR